MEQIVYIKAPQCVELQHTNIVLGDFLTVYSPNQQLQQQIVSIPFHNFHTNQKEQLIVSILKIIELIIVEFPNAELQNLGEEDVIINYTPISRSAKLKEFAFTAFICFVAFFGGGYAIMAYNTDAGAKELFTFLSMLFLGNATSGVSYLIVTYSIGLTLGMILFFNHIGHKKLTSDPTPLEVQMRLYENDLSTTIIQNADRLGEHMEIHHYERTSRS